MMKRNWFVLFLSIVIGLSAFVSCTEDVIDYVNIMTENPEEFTHISMIELEEHESKPTPPFSVCKYLLEAASENVKKGDDWPSIAKHIAKVRESLPEHVRSACDAFIKHNREDIISLLQVSQTDITSSLESVAAKAASQQQQQNSLPAALANSTNSGQSQQDVFQQFWQTKGQYCGACLTMTKKIQKWLNLNCTQAVIVDRIMRMCNTMPSALSSQCQANRVWISDFVIKQLLNKFSLPNHCAYIGLCEKTMVVRALQNPMVMASTQNALLEKIEGTGDLVQENELVLQQAVSTPNTAPEITFDLGTGDVSYDDVEKSQGSDLPKIYMDGTGAPPSKTNIDFSSMLEVGSKDNGPSIFDLSNPNDPSVIVNAQDPSQVNIPVMHTDLTNQGATVASKDYAFQQNKLPIDQTWLLGCASCQFTIGALYEFLSNPRTIRTILPVIKKACDNCNNADEVLKCQNFIENQGVAFYQDVIRQGQPSKWCPRLQLCEIQYFYPSPHVLADTYASVQDQIVSIPDF